MMLFHRHRWICVSALQYTDVTYSNVGIPKTMLNLRCTCTKVKSGILVGRWTVEQVNGTL